MPDLYEIRAVYNENTITVYQAYNKIIGQKASEQNKFSEPFSFNRMTWIKPSFLWMMERSGWGKKPNQECILAIKIKRDYFEKALLEAILTSPEKNVYKDSDEWNKLKKSARINVQWDPERDIYGNKLEYRSIQIGISRHLIQEFNDLWIESIEDISKLVNKIYKLKISGNTNKGKLFLPDEKIYPLSNDIQQKLGMNKNKIIN